MTITKTSLQPNHNPIHWAVTLKAKEGREQDLENALMNFLKRSLGEYGSTGAHLIRSSAESGEGEFLLHRSFLSNEHSRLFYESALFREYQDATAELIKGPARIRPLHGFESFIRGSLIPTPRWKIAVVTWLGVFPAVSIWSAVLSVLRDGMNPLAFTAMLTLLVVASLTWLIMPRLMAAFRPWLNRRHEVIYSRVPCH